MNKHKQEPAVGLSEIGVGLDELIRRGARQVIQQAIDAELAELLGQFSNVTTLHGQRAVVRNGYLPEREVLTAAGAVTVESMRSRFRSTIGNCNRPTKQILFNKRHDQPHCCHRSHRR